MKYYCLVLAIALVGCNGLQTLKNEVTGLTPYEAYVLALERANLSSRPLGNEWIDAGLRALKDSTFVMLPYTEAGHFLSHKPEARSYRFDVRDGQVLTLNGAMKAGPESTIFADLFLYEDNKWKHLSSSDSTLTISHEFTKNASCLLRIQPELLVNAYYAVSISLTPVLINPVMGANNNSIQSFWGDSRDGGKRRHEGIDIFAKKGTPVVAPTSGRVSRIGNTKLGGKVVWMYDQKRNHSYYFAHLDSQYVEPGMFLKQGDTLGTVGNTGNAKYTPPHLHFGIYQTGAKDPVNYVRTMEALAHSPAVDTTFIRSVYTIGSSKALLHVSPAKKAESLLKLERDTFVDVVAQSKDWYRVQLPDYTEGFVRKEFVKRGTTSRERKLRFTTSLRGDIRAEADTIGYLEAGSAVKALAQYKDFVLIQNEVGVQGWIPKANL